MPNRNIDLHKLPRWAQYLIALTVVGIIGGAAWLVGRGRPVPDWMTSYLFPCLGWAYIILLVLVLVFRWRRKQ